MIHAAVTVTIHPVTYILLHEIKNFCLIMYVSSLSFLPLRKVIVSFPSLISSITKLHLLPITKQHDLEQLNINPSSWLTSKQHFNKFCKPAAAAESNIMSSAYKMHPRKWQSIQQPVPNMHNNNYYNV